MPQTATNPQTGEKVMWNGTAWEPMGGSASAPPAGPVVQRIGTPKAPDAFKVRDQQLQEEAAARAREDQEFQRQKFEREMAQKDKEGVAGKVTESERTAAFLSTNLYGATAQLQEAIKGDPEAAKPTVGAEIAGIFGATARNFANSAARQQVESAQMTILDNALTLGTGAAYTREQLNAYRQSYFPQLGDSDAAIKDKQVRLRTLLEAARTKAGNQAGQIDQAMNALGLQPQVTQSGPNVGVFGNEPEGIKGDRWTDQQRGLFRQFLKENPNATVAELTGFLDANKFPGGIGNAEEVLFAARKGVIPDREDYSQVDAAARSAAEAELTRVNEMSPRTDAGTLVTQGATLGLSDEAAGLGRGLSFALGGRNPVDGYRLGRDAERLRIEDARSQLGWGGTALEVGGGLLSANPAAAISAVPGNAMRSLVGQGARAGAVGGGIAGYGYGDGLDQSLGGAALGAGIGASLGAGVSALSTRFAPRGLAPDIAQAADAEGVRLIRPMVDPASRNALSALEVAPGSATRVQEGIGAVADDIEQGVGRLAADGRPLDTEAAGGAVQGAARRFIQRSRGVADRLYTRARSLAGDTRVEPQTALAQLDNELTALRANPETNAGEIAMLEGLQADLSTAGGKSVDDLRALRTSIRGRINEKNLTATQAEARAMRVLDSVHDDLRVLPNGASDAFRRADTYYRERMTHIDDVTARFLGPRDRPLSGEQAFARLKSMTQPNGDGRRLAAMWRDLAPAEQQDVAATIAQSLGRRGPDEPFSTALLVSHAAKLSPSARRTIFGPGGAESIGNLITLSRSLNDATGKLNRSNTARSLLQDTGRSIAAAVIGGPAAGVMTGSAAAGGAVAAATIGLSATRMGIRNLSARALMSPRVARWVAALPDVRSPSQAQSTVRQLGVIISREPAIAGELQQLQRSIAEAFRTAPARASEAENEGGNDEQP